MGSDFVTIFTIAIDVGFLGHNGGTRELPKRKRTRMSFAGCRHGEELTKKSKSSYLACKVFQVRLLLIVFAMDENIARWIDEPTTAHEKQPLQKGGAIE